MNKRLNAISTLINDVDSVIDVGCDHAYLSIYCLENNKAKFFYNVDVNQGPLSAGFENAKKRNLDTKCKFILNDGLKDLDISADVLVIAGMGGANIIDILSHAKNQYHKYIVQPNNNTKKVRVFLKENNFSITNELLVKENDVFYEIIEFSKSAKQSNIIDDVDCYIGPILKQQTSDLFYEYLTYKQKQFSKFIDRTTNQDIINENTIITNLLLNSKGL